MIKSSPNNCPVPRAQQPIHEYEELKNAWLFRNITLGWPSYISQIFWTWIWSWLVAGPVAAASFSPDHHLTQFLLAGTAGASVGVVLILVRLYLGWFYISDRLHSATVFYEESGWYDGQTWSKPPEIVNRDRLIVNYEIKPILHRLQFTFMALAGIYLTGTIVWRWL